MRARSRLERQPADECCEGGMSQRSGCGEWDRERAKGPERVRLSRRLLAVLGRGKRTVRTAHEPRARGALRPANSNPLVSRRRGWRPDHPVVCSGLPLHPLIFRTAISIRLATPCLAARLAGHQAAFVTADDSRTRLAVSRVRKLRKELCRNSVGWARG